LGLYGRKVEVVSDCTEEIMLLWAMQQPILSKHNAFVSQSSLQLRIEACGRPLCILQSPSSLGAAGVTGSVMWDSGIVLGKFLEHSVESKAIHFQGKKVVELGSGCGLVGLTAAYLGGEVILTDQHSMLRLLRKNVESNLDGNIRGSATVAELTWGDYFDQHFTDPPPDFVVGSDIVFSESGVEDLMDALGQLCGRETTVILAAELRNDEILEYFLEAATKEFTVGRVDGENWHPEFRTHRVVIYVLVKK
ncbi:hypothetical protein M569_15191, partial [Genlisea aurea]